MTSSLFSITWGSRTVGGASTSLRLHDSYIIEKSFDSLRLVFDVAVIASSYSSLKSLSESLETSFRKRDQSLTISINGQTFAFTSGSTLLNSGSSIVKTGDRDSDQGLSRIYSCTVFGDLPADDASTGLKDIEWNVNFEASRQQTVSMRGVYSATEAKTASANYLAYADTEQTTFLGALTGTFELVDESYAPDRNNHFCEFSRQFLQTLYDQGSAGLEDTEIVDHHVVFTDFSQHPGDSEESIYRMRRVSASFDAGVDFEVSQDPKDVIENKIKPFLISEFESEFSPQVFAIEDSRGTYDPTSNRVSMTIQFLYQKTGGEDIVETATAVTLKEARTIDATYTHDGGELSAYVDAGWVVMERVVTRTTIVIGKEEPRRRLTGASNTSGPAGPLNDLEAPDGNVRPEGWIIVNSVSGVTPSFVGDPDEEQIEMSTLNETVIEQFFEAPKGGGNGTGTTGGKDPNYKGPVVPPKKDFRDK